MSRRARLWVGVAVLALVGAAVLAANLGHDSRRPPASTIAPSPSTTAAASTDERFAQVLIQAGLSMPAGQARTLAAAVCASFDQHPDESLTMAAVQLARQQGWSADQAGAFIGGAVAGYCPEHRDVIGLP